VGAGRLVPALFCALASTRMGLRNSARLPVLLQKIKKVLKLCTANNRPENGVRKSESIVDRFVASCNAGNVLVRANRQKKG
jgi:hypothetical protein